MNEFSKLFNSISKVPASQVTLDPQTLASGLQGKPPQQAADELTSRVALSTPLTKDAVRPIVQAAMDAQGNDVQQAAQQVSSQLSSLSGSAELQLSTPNPLSWQWRVLFAVGMVGTVITALVLSAIAHSNGTAEYVALGILGGLGWLGSVLFVMAYGTVDLKGSSGASQ